MKKLLITACAVACALALAGCGSQAASSSVASASAQASSSAAASAADEPETSTSAESASAEAASAEASSAAEEATEPVATEPVSYSEWSKVDSAAAAAQAAGFEGFDVMDEVTIGDMTFTKPWFGYLDGVAQAAYEQPACVFYIRKADGVYGAALSDRDYSEFASKWTQNHKGLEINCYGAEEGAATLIQWNVGSEAFAATYQGLGGEEMTMTPDDITSIVSGIQ